MYVLWSDPENLTGPNPIKRFGSGSATLLQQSLYELADMVTNLAILHGFHEAWTLQDIEGDVGGDSPRQVTSRTRVHSHISSLNIIIVEGDSQVTSRTRVHSHISSLNIIIVEGDSS